MTTITVQHFVNGLKSRNRDEQNKAAADLILYVKTELREMNSDCVALFLDDFNHHIFDMVSSSDPSEKKGDIVIQNDAILLQLFYYNDNIIVSGGILAIKCLISGDVVNTASRIPRYSNILRNLLPSNDVSVMEIAAKTLVKLALLPGSKGAESFDFDLKRAFEWLSEERNEVWNNRHKKFNTIVKIVS